MQATHEQVTALLQLQEIDRKVLQAQKQLEQLPQREAIMSLRNKRAELAKKISVVEQMYEKASTELNVLITEDGIQAEKQKETQAKIDETQGDYRNVDSLTRDLLGIAKRRETLEKKMDDANQKLDDVDKVRKQAYAAASSLEEQEGAQVASFKLEGGKLQDGIAKVGAMREQLAASLPVDLLSEYEKVSKRCGGVALARLQDSTCSVCRNTIVPNKLLELQHQAPISFCPNCNRLLVVE